MKTILIVLAVALIPCCEKNNTRASPPGGPTVGVLDPSAITEMDLDRDIVEGMSQLGVEARLGKTYQYKVKVNRTSATYYVRRPLTNVPEMTGFTIIYYDGKVDHVDKSWLAVGGDLDQ